MKATPAQQQELLALADIDQRIRRLNHQRANLAEQQTLDRHVEAHKGVTADLIEATQRQDRLKASSAKHERDIQTADAGRKHSEAQIYSGKLTSERELAARREEMGEFRRRKSDLEDALLEIMEELEEVTSKVEELTTRRSELDSQIDDLTVKRDAAAADIDGELEELTRRRDQDLETLPGGLTAAYEQVAKNRKGPAVARLDGKICSGCHMELTAIELEEITATAKDSLAYCEQCGSILVPTG